MAKKRKSKTIEVAGLAERVSASGACPACASHQTRPSPNVVSHNDQEYREYACARCGCRFGILPEDHMELVGRDGDDA